MQVKCLCSAEDSSPCNESAKVGGNNPLSLEIDHAGDIIALFRKGCEVRSINRTNLLLTLHFATRARELFRSHDERLS
jgi:hypothetical protein